MHRMHAEDSEHHLDVRSALLAVYSILQGAEGQQVPGQQASFIRAICRTA